jgi:hypothetical protein
VGVAGAGEEEVAEGGPRGMVGTSPETGAAGLAPPSPAKARQRFWDPGGWKQRWTGGGADLGGRRRSVTRGTRKKLEKEEEEVWGCAVSLLTATLSGVKDPPAAPLMCSVGDRLGTDSLRP